MSLIKCIECGKEISDKSESCPHCGCPTNESINKIDMQISDYKCKNCSNTKYTKIENQGGVFLICDKCGYVDEILPRQQSQTAENQDKLFYKCPVCNKEFKEGTLECDVCKYTSIILPVQNIKGKESLKPKCPKCGSTAITAGQRGYTLLTGFLGSNKTVNRCANCGHTWKPMK